MNKNKFSKGRWWRAAGERGMSACWDCSNKVSRADIYFLTVLEARSLRSTFVQSCFLLRPFSVVCIDRLLPEPSYGPPSENVCVHIASPYKFTGRLRPGLA